MHEEALLAPPWILRGQFFYIILHIVYPRDGEGTGLTKTDTAGEVSFAGIITLTNPVFRLVLNVNGAYFKLRQQYQNWPRAINRPNPYRRFADTPLRETLLRNSCLYTHQAVCVQAG
jgi:hypothetical protein